MKLKISILLCCLLPGISVLAQHMPDYRLHQVRITDTGKTIRAEVLPFNGRPSARPELLYYWYDANTIHSLQGGYSGQLLNGAYEEYYPNKNVKTQGNFNKGLKDGIWKSWNDRGMLTELITWNNGVRSGAFTRYNSEGIPVESGKYRNDLLNGNVSFYQGRDSVKVVHYQDGKQVAPKPSLLQKINIFHRKKAKA
ncbi:MAG TPA: hypothetical protein VIM77_13810 [Mucilaginibacter sp.]